MSLGWGGECQFCGNCGQQSRCPDCHTRLGEVEQPFILEVAGTGIKTSNCGQQSHWQEFPNFELFLSTFSMLFWVSGRQLSGWSIKQKENEPDLAVALMILMTTWQMVIGELSDVTSVVLIVAFANHIIYDHQLSSSCMSWKGLFTLLSTSNNFRNRIWIKRSGLNWPKSQFF